MPDYSEVGPTDVTIYATPEGSSPTQPRLPDVVVVEAAPDGSVEASNVRVLMEMVCVCCVLVNKISPGIAKFSHRVLCVCIGIDLESKEYSSTICV